MVPIKQAEFVRSLTGGAGYFNTGLPELAVVGKSNVGKSSLINMLTNNNKMARVSKQPGKTRLINYFLLNQAFYLVDLPGYGFARVSKEEQQNWADMMESYFKAAKYLKAVLLLMDIRHKPTKGDLDMLHFVEYHAIPYIVVATKGDKIAKSKRKMECDRLRGQITSSFAYDIIPVSSEDGYGKEALLAKIEQYVASDHASALEE